MKLLLDFDGRRLQGVRPFAVFEAFGSHFTIQSSKFPSRSGSGDALSEIRRLLDWSRESLGTSGAAIGFFSYDFGRTLESRAFQKSSPLDELKLPDMRLVFCEQLAVSTSAEGQSTSAQKQIGKPSQRNQLKDDLQTPTAEYAAAIARIQEDIAAGDIYQANYATRFSSPLPCSPAQLYERLRSTHLAPFSGLLEWDDFAIVSNSPERFLKLENRTLTAQPIKGTAPRGNTPEADEHLKNELLRSEKNRAENVMIVDLMRNDLGRVCQYGSVEVPQLFEVQTFATLHHLVSTVIGVLRTNCDGLDAFAAAFPCGSITGAPKIRAMQIIDELESTRRGASFGAVGYFGFDGNMEWNVAIRTITCKNGTAYFHTGGGIVADSDMADEYSEMQLKARALLEALGSECKNCECKSDDSKSDEFKSNAPKSGC